METSNELQDRITRAVALCEENRQSWFSKQIHAILQPCPSCGAWDGCPGCIVPPDDSEQAETEKLAIKLIRAYSEIEHLKRKLNDRRESSVMAGLRFLPAVMSELGAGHQELTTREQQLMDAAIVVHMRRVGYLDSRP